MHQKRLAFVRLFEFVGGGIGRDVEEVVVGFGGGGGEEGAAAAEEEGNVQTHPLAWCRYRSKFDKREEQCRPLDVGVCE